MSKGTTQRRIGIATALMILLAAIGCSDGHTYFHQYKAVDVDGWMNGDTVVFHLTPSSCQQTLAAEVGVRTTDAFKYNTLYLLGELRCEDQLISTDTLTVNIFDEDGLSLGNGFPYPTSTSQLPPIAVDSGLNYTYTITPYMQPEQVVGVKDIGIKLSVLSASEE